LQSLVDEGFHKGIVRTRIKSNDEGEHSLSSFGIFREFLLVLFMLLQGPSNHLVD
jgi:hypothetical protein